MSLEANKAIARRIWDEVFNERNLALADELVAQDAVNHEWAPPGVPERGPDNLRAVVMMLTAAFPDLHMTVDAVIAEDDKVVLQLTASGTHRGAFMGIAPTGRHFAQRHIDVVRIQDGKIVEHWMVRDDLGMFQQLGLVAFPQPAASVVPS